MSSETSVEVKLDELPINVRQVLVEGASHTNPTYIYKYLDTVPKATTVGEMNDALRESLTNLSRTTLFKNVDIEVDASEAPNSSPADVDVCVKLTEVTKLGFDIGVRQNTDRSGAVGTVGLLVRNSIFGYGERLQINAASDHQGTNPTFKSISAKLANIRPSVSSRSAVSLGVFRNVIDKSDLASFTGRADGATVGWSSDDSRHQVEYEGSFRQMTPHGASSAIVNESIVPQFKSAVRYTYRNDMRFPSSCNPTSGSLASTTLETSGFGGDVAVAKAEVLRQHHIALNNSVSLAVSARAGVAQPWSNINKIVNAVIAGKAADNTPAAKGPYTAVPVLDRFFHNTLFVRGVAPRDIGPKAGADALGGDLYTAATVSLSAAIPRYEQLPVRPHVFVNAGNLVSLTDFLNNPGDRKCPMSGSTKASVGTGIVLGTQLGRIELNMAAPVTNDGIGKFAFSLGGSIDW